MDYKGGRNNWIDFTGQKFGLLVAEGRTEHTHRQGERLERKWILRCSGCNDTVSRFRSSMTRKSFTCGKGDCKRLWNKLKVTSLAHPLH